MVYRTNFGDLPNENSNLEKAKIVILPVPYDGTSTWVKGADKGPEAIIEASANMELYDIETDSEVYKRNIFTASPILEKQSPEKMVKEVKRTVASFLEKDKFVVTIGGEHSITVGAVGAYKEKYNNLSVLQFDAHSDLRQEYNGSKFNHACVMARIRELCPITQVGIRSMDISEKMNLDKSRIFFAENIYNNTDWHKKALAKLTNKVYISIDLDVFDPSVFPSTGTPEPGGLGWYQVIDFLKKVNKEKEIVGFDIMELCPNKQEKSSDFFAAKLIYKLLSYRFFNKI